LHSVGSTRLEDNFLSDAIAGVGFGLFANNHYVTGGKLHLFYAFILQVTVVLLSLIIENWKEFALVL
jgi:hypothetical protein